MTHEECQDRLLEFAYGELDRRGTREVEAHLAGCPVCAGVYRRIAGVREVMGRLEPEPPPGRGDRLVLAAARQAADRRREERPALGLPLWAWKASVATVLVAAVAGVSVKIASMRQRSATEEFAAAPAGTGTLDALKLEAPAGAEPAAAAPSEAPAAGSAPSRPGLAARAAKPAPRPPAAPAPPRPSAAPAPQGIGFAEKGSGAPAREAAPEAVARRLRTAEPEAVSRTAERQESATPQAAVPGATADAESKASAPAAAAQAQPPAPRTGPPLAAARKKGDPAVQSARAVVQEVEARLRQGKLSESARPFQACGPAEDAERRLYTDPDGRVVKYVRQTGSAEAALTTEQYYDRQGRLRHVYVHGGAVNGAVLEHRIWLDQEGRRLLEEQRFRRGSYPFPETWPEAELAPEAPEASALECGAP